MKEWYWVGERLRVNDVREWVYERKNEWMRTVELEKEWMNKIERLRETIR